MSTIPDLPGVLAETDIIRSAEHLADLQTSSGMIPWWPGGHCDPWNHVESAMALDVAGLHTEAERGYEWLADIQRPDALLATQQLLDFLGAIQQCHRLGQQLKPQGIELQASAQRL